MLLHSFSVKLWAISSFRAGTLYSLFSIWGNRVLYSELMEREQVEKIFTSLRKKKKTAPEFWDSQPLLILGWERLAPYSRALPRWLISPLAPLFRFRFLISLLGTGSFSCDCSAVNAITAHSSPRLRAPFSPPPTWHLAASYHVVNQAELIVSFIWRTCLWEH